MNGKGSRNRSINSNYWNNYAEAFQTVGTRIASEIRKKCNKLTQEERKRLLEKGMEIMFK